MGHRGTLPGVSATPEDRIIMHVDLDCFYAACERRRDPALTEDPVVVGMEYTPGTTDGAVATASYDARAHGVASAQSIEQAMEHLPPTGTSTTEPTAHYRPVDMDYYEAVSEDVRAVLSTYATTLRVVSIDEAYLEVTDRTDWDHAAAYATEIKTAVADSVGLTASVGVAPTMHAAKIASDHDKPDGLVCIAPGTVSSFLAPLPIEDLHGVGPVTAGELRERDIETIGDLAAADPAPLVKTYGQRGRTLHQRARGIDRRAVEPQDQPKSLSRESAFSTPTAERSAVCQRLETLAQAVADRAQSQGALYQTIGIKIIEPPYDVLTRERSLSGPIDDPELVVEIVMDLFEEFIGRTLRKIGVRVSNLTFPDGDQAQLDTWAVSPPTPEPSNDHRGVSPSGQTTLTEFITSDNSDLSGNNR